jgi:hypothetical protein
VLNFGTLKFYKECKERDAFDNYDWIDALNPEENARYHRNFDKYFIKGYHKDMRNFFLVYTVFDRLYAYYRIYKDEIY